MAVDKEWLSSRIADETIELVLVFRDEGRIIWSNEAACRKLEYESQDLTECSMNQIFRQDEEFRQLQKRNENEYKDLISIFPTIFGLL